MPIYINCKQGESDWLRTRCGIPTASNFKKLVTTKGTRSGQRMDYLCQIASERITGEIYSGFYGADMERGNEQENSIIGAYEWEFETEVKRVGFAFKDKKKLFGCSPDGLIGDDGGIECKSANQKVHIHRIYKPDSFVTEHFQQVQGCLYVTERKWWDLVSYSPLMKLLRIRIYPDIEFFKKLEKELILACEEIDAIVKSYKEYNIE